MNNLLKINMSFLFFLYQHEIYERENLIAGHKNIINIRRNTPTENTDGSVNDEIVTRDINDGYVEINWENTPCFIQENTGPVFFYRDNIRCILIIENWIFDFNFYEEVVYGFESDTNTINYVERRGENSSYSPILSDCGKMVFDNLFPERTLYVNSKITRLVPQEMIMIHYDILSFPLRGAAFYAEENKFKGNQKLLNRKIKGQYILFAYALHLQSIYPLPENGLCNNTISNFGNDFSAVSHVLKCDCKVVGSRYEIKENITILFETWVVLRMDNSDSR